MRDAGDAKAKEELASKIGPDSEEMERVARTRYLLSHLRPHFEHGAFLVDGFVMGGMPVTCAPGSFPKQFDHSPDNSGHDAGHQHCEHVLRNASGCSVLLQGERMHQQENADSLLVGDVLFNFE